jgi:hypothetical protein
MRVSVAVGGHVDDAQVNAMETISCRPPTRSLRHSNAVLIRRRYTAAKTVFRWGARMGPHPQGVDEAAVEEFLNDIAATTPREMTRYALPLAALVQQGRYRRTAQGHTVSLATLTVTLRRLRRLLIAEP